MDDARNGIEIAPGLFVPEGILRYRFDRSPGPGGQNVNKLNTRATLTVALDALAEHLPGDVMGRLIRLAGPWLGEDQLVISSHEHRSQHANRRACIDKLRRLIVRARVRPRPRKPTRPTRGSIERRLQCKKRRGDIKRRRQSPSADG